MQDEHDPFGRGEPLQHHKQRQPDTVIDGDTVGRIGQARLGGRGRGLDLAGIVPSPGVTARI